MESTPVRHTESERSKYARQTDSSRRECSRIVTCDLCSVYHSLSKRGMCPEVTNWKFSKWKVQSCHSSSTYLSSIHLKYQILHPHSQHIAMAPLLKSLYRPSQRSLLSSLFTATFLGAVVVVAFPCPIRPTNISGRAEARLDSESNTNTGRRNGEVVVLMNQRGRRFLEER